MRCISNHTFVTVLKHLISLPCKLLFHIRNYNLALNNYDSVLLLIEDMKQRYSYLVIVRDKSYFTKNNT